MDWGELPDMGDVLFLFFYRRFERDDMSEELVRVVVVRWGRREGILLLTSMMCNNFV